MLKALNKQGKTSEDVKSVIDLWYSEGWIEDEEEVKSKMKRFCTKLITSFLKNRVFKNASLYVSFLDSCRFVYSDEEFATLANRVIDALEQQDDQSYFNQLSHRFVMGLTEKNRKVYDEATSCPWERILEAKLFSEEELDAAKLLVPIDDKLVKHLTIFKRYLIVVLGLKDFWTGTPWKSVLKKQVFAENIKQDNKGWSVTQRVVSTLKSGQKGVRAVQSPVIMSAAAQPMQPSASSIQPAAPLVEQKGVFVDSGLPALTGVAFTVCWVENSVLRAYDNPAIQAMSVWDPNGDLPVTKKDNHIEIDLLAGSLKTTKVTLSMLQVHLQLMKDSHKQGFYTGPLLVWEMNGQKFSATPPFCGSVGEEYANCGPKKTTLKPSPKSDLTLLFTCLQETDSENPLWKTCLEEVSDGKTVDDFLQQIESETGLD